MAIEDDDKPRKKISHEIGQDLSLLSVEELAERIALMTARDRAAAGGDDQEARVEGCGEQFFQVVSSAIGARAARERAAAHQQIATRLGHTRFHSANGRHGKRSLKKTVRLRSIKLSRL